MACLGQKPACGDIIHTAQHDIRLGEIFLNSMRGELPADQVQPNLAIEPMELLGGRLGFFPAQILLRVENLSVEIR